MIDNKTGLTQIDKFHNFQRNDDGSVDVYFAPTAPKGREANWIPTSEDFFLVFRLYGPEPSAFDKSWKLAEIEKVE